MSELKTFTSERIYWAVKQVEREAGDIDNLHLDDNSFYIQSDADQVIAAYKDERDCLQAELDELRSEREALGQVKSAATYLLENYSSSHPSAGEVDALAEDITQLLTEKYNISKGII